MPSPSRRRNEIQALIVDLGRIPQDVRREMRPAIREAAKQPLQKAKANASWSSRIPGALSIRTRLTGRQAGVRIEANRQKAPHARNWEGLTRRREARWPVFGNRDVWVSQPIRPFLSPAVGDSSDDIAQAIDDVVVNVARSHGFR